MKMNNFKLVRASGLAIMLLAAGGFTLVPTPWNVAYAGNGNGSGNDDRGGGNAGRNADRGNRNNASAHNRGGNGEIASELRGLNAAHANPNALANASPNSMPGMLYTYQQSTGAAVEAQAAVDQAQAEVDYLASLDPLDPEVIPGLYPDTEAYDAAVLAADSYLAEQQGLLAEAELVTEAALEAATGGRVLSDAALEELHNLLGL